MNAEAEVAMQARFLSTLTILVWLVACSSTERNSGTSGAAGSGAESPGPSAGAEAVAGNASSGASAGSSGSATGGKSSVFGGADCPSDLGLSATAALTNVKGTVDGSDVRITFDPTADAKDYRVYVLPKAGDLMGETVKGATYRCAGNYAVPFPAEDDNKMPENPGVRTRVASKVQGFDRTLPEATLGYVFTTPAADRVPVYALGASDLKADNIDCYFMRWPESRVKTYTASETERTQLLAEHWRDDGIAFYAPKPDASGARKVSRLIDTKDQNPAPFYLVPGAEYDARKAKGLDAAEAFSVYADGVPGAAPLMRVYYEQACAHGHDELAVGQARFEKAFHQGASPVGELHFSGLTKDTTLVVEALDASCPFQGIVAPASRPARKDPFMGFDVDYPAFQTPEELAAASATGEVFINGQGDGTKPHAVARACLKLAPAKPAADMSDWSYDGTPETFSEPAQKGFQIWELESPTFNVQYHTVATDEFTIGGMFGELWATYGDWAADTNGKLRITPKTRATLAADAFVHAQMEVDMVSTQRRYPQLLISDQDWPVQDNLVKGTTVLVQTFGGITMPIEGQIQFCDHRTWDVNNQCPMYDLERLGAGDARFLSPRPELNGFSGVDRTMRFDVYVSTSRAYLLTNGQPYACVELPADKLAAGTATVTFGDVLYHSGADLEAWYPFHLAKLHNVTSRHFSNLAFSSKVAAPPWDEARIPCVPASGLK
jgi:Repeat of unknown function (DUF5648)